METTIPENVGVSTSRLARVQPAMQSLIDQGRLPGILTMVARRGQVIHNACCGWRDLEAKKPVEIDTLFPIFSITKPILATALMILYEEGYYQLSEPLSRYIPAFKNVRVIKKSNLDGLELAPLDREITLYDLLTQTSGLFYDDLGSPQIAKMLEEIAPFHPDIDLEECTRRMAQLPLNHQPGKGWRYGEVAEVLGRVVEVISGASDYMSFCQMLLNKGELDGRRILGRKTVEYMTRNHLPQELIPIEVLGTAYPGYGYGFLLGVMVDTIRAGMLCSEGEYMWGGLSTLFWADPQEGLIGLQMTRTEFPNHAPAYLQFRTLVYQALIY